MKIIRRMINAIFLSVAMIAAFVPGTQMVHAADNDPAMTEGSESVLKGTVNKKDAQTVWYAGKTWRVISYDGTGIDNSKPRDAMTLFASNNFGTSAFSDSNRYSDSDLQGALNAQFRKEFTEKEKKAVRERSLEVHTLKTNPMYNTGVAGTATSGNLWPLSTIEARSVQSSLRSADDDWWLRSAGLISSGKEVGYVNRHGKVEFEGEEVVTGSGKYIIKGMRPAFNLELNAVSFTSAASGGKDSGLDGSLTPVGSNTTGEWKLTLLDDGTISGLSDHQNFRIDPDRTSYDPASRKVTIYYSGAKTGTNEYISAVIKDSTGSIKYYGRILELRSSILGSAMATLTIPDDFNEGDKIYVFNEQYNGDRKTDYASALKEVDFAECEFVSIGWVGNEQTGYTDAWAFFQEKGDSSMLKVYSVSLTEEVIEPTCEEGGKTVYTATLPADQSVDAIAHQATMEAKYTETLGHQWDFESFSWTGNDEDGYTAAAARYVCGNDSSHTQEVEAEVSFADREATCEVGSMRQFMATVSASASPDKKERSETKGIQLSDPPGHQWGAWETITEPTDENAGEDRRKCSVCGAEDTKIVPPLEHTHQISPVKGREAKCVESGIKDHYKCDSCGALFMDSEGNQQVSEGAIRIPAVGHKPGSPLVDEDSVTEATCSFAGGYTANINCEKCGMHLSEKHITYEPDPDAHVWDEGTVIKKPTALSPGEKALTCTLDPEHTSTQVIPPAKYRVTITDISQINTDGTGDRIQVKLKVVDENGTEISGDPANENYDPDYDRYSALVQFGSREAVIADSLNDSGEVVLTDTLPGSDNGRDYKITAALICQDEEASASQSENIRFLAEAEPETVTIIRPRLILKTDCADEGESNGSITVKGDQGQSIRYYPQGASPEGAPEGSKKITGLAAGSYVVFTEASAKDQNTFYIRSSTDETALIHGHDWSDWIISREAACTIKGEKTRHCWYNPEHKQTMETDTDPDVHIWGDWTVTKKPTETRKGTRIRECKGCHAAETKSIPAKGYAPGKDPNQTGRDGTAVGPGASAAAAEKAIMSLKSDTDPKGAVYLPLKLKSSKQTKTSVTISWTKAKGAVRYAIYGNRCGKANKMKKLATVKGKSRVFKKITGKKVRKGTAYKFIVVALDQKNNVIATSRMIHAFTKGGRQTNHKSVKLKLKSGKKYKAAKKVTLKVGKTAGIRGVGVKAVKKQKYKKHVKMRYESSDQKIATVTAGGVIKGRKKGKCYVWAYSQNGIGKRIKVIIK